MFKKNNFDPCLNDHTYVTIVELNTKCYGLKFSEK